MGIREGGSLPDTCDNFVQDLVGCFAEVVRCVKLAGCRCPFLQMSVGRRQIVDRNCTIVHCAGNAVLPHVSKERQPGAREPNVTHVTPNVAKAEMRVIGIKGIDMIIETRGHVVQDKRIRVPSRDGVVKLEPTGGRCQDDS